MTKGLSRRAFLTRATVAGGGLLLGGQFMLACRASNGAGALPLNAWVRVGADDLVTLIVSQAEIGQGTSTTLPALLADELGADWTRVRFENAPADPRYRNPRVNWQFTGNSESITAFYDLMRQMGAAAREMLRAAAAERWQVDPMACEVNRGAVTHIPTGRRFTFGALAEDAAQQPVPTDPPLKPRSAWTLAGRTVPRVDIPSKVDGSAVFGIDVVRPEMVHAAITMSPTHGGRVSAVDRSGLAGLAGVIDVVSIPPIELTDPKGVRLGPGPSGVAVLATTTWHAQRALRALKVTWDEGPHAAVSSESLRQAYDTAIGAGPWETVKQDGDPDTFAAPDLVADYESQFLAHATMEPMNCTAHVTTDGCDIWAPTQGQELTQIMVAALLDLPREQVRVNRTLAGGGFGRRLLADFAVQAALVSREADRPVKLTWSREEDMRHDVYRPAVRHRLAARVDRAGHLISLHHQLVSPSILQYIYPWAVSDTLDPSCLEGLLEHPYTVPATRVDFHLLSTGVPTSVWRTTGYGPNIFALEGFVDELAHRAGMDPYAYRRALLASNARACAVLDAAATRAGWSEPSPRRARGLAFAECFGTLVATVVEVSVSGSDVDIHRVTVALDPGIVLDPGNATAQVEGGVAWGLCAAMSSEITFEGGRTVQSNWHDYHVTQLREMPPVDVHFLESAATPPGGVAEVGPVTLVPALVNAISSAAGRPLRSLPLARHGFRLARSV